ncbi:MAG: helix-turn-helix transcriptional regulator [Candidatus Melainabacteria bacterium]|nr:helix-turn-helix transcriptional regulator [Candidatus Melainabacteria bacterium]
MSRKRRDIFVPVSLYDLLDSLGKGKSISIATGRVVQQLRNVRGLSQYDLASLSGLQRSHIGAIELGFREISVKSLYRLSVSLQIKPSEFTRLIEIEFVNQPEVK